MSARERVVVALPDVPERSQLPPLPPFVHVLLVPEAAGGIWPDLSAVEFLVPGFGSRERLLAELSGLQRLRVIQTLTAGVDWLRGRVPDGVTVCNARGAYDAPLAEWVIAAILAFQRGVLRARDSQARGAWEPFELESIAGRRVVILGMGSIGKALADRLRPFSVEIVGVARTRRGGVIGVQELDSILPRTDVLIDLLPLTADTEGFVDAKRLRLLPNGSLVVNAGRGRTLDTAALLAEVIPGRILAALDVTDPEPLPDGHPLWALPNVLISPHIAGDSRDSLTRVLELVADQVRRHATGQALSNVVPSYQLR